MGLVQAIYSCACAYSVLERGQRVLYLHARAGQSVVSSVMIEHCATKVDTSLCFHNKLADKEFYIVAC